MIFILRVAHLNIFPLCVACAARENASCDDSCQPTAPQSGTAAQLKYARIDAHTPPPGHGRRRLPAPAHRATINNAHESEDGPDRRLRLLVAQERHDVDAGHRRASGGAGPVPLDARLRGHAVL